MDFSIQNGQLIVKIKSKGAELFSIYHKQLQLEYMWSADPKFWAKTSPVLFPIVGTLKDNIYYFNNKSYQLPRHGFARDEEFVAENQQLDSITFLLKGNPTSKEKYPFDFELRVTYGVKGNSLSTSYEVKNTGNEEMFFSLGGHPAFKVPLVDGLNYEDYYLEFNKSEKADRWPITKEGLIKTETQPMLNGTTIHLSKKLFAEDALVFKHLQSDVVTLKTDRNNHSLTFSFKGFPYLGIWAQAGADFVCIEPWCGHADSVTHDQQLTTKEGIEKLSKGSLWTRSWQAAFW